MSLDPVASRHIEKTTVGKAARTLGTPIAWVDVLRCLQSDRARSGATIAYRAAGFSADDFANVRKAREAMADALTRTEDDLEMAGPRAQAERAAIRAVRRRLERELHP